MKNRHTFPLALPARPGSLLLLTLCALVALALPGCKKKEDAAAAAAAATNNEPAPPPKPVEPPTEFKGKWPVGKRLVMRNQTDSNIELTMPAAPEPIKNAIQQTTENALSVVREREAGGYDLELEFLAQKMDVKNAGKQAMAFDTRSDPKSDRTNAPQQTFRKSIGSKLKFQTAVDGRVTKIEGGPALLSKFTLGVPVQQQAMYKAMFTDDALKGMVTIHDGLPDHPVKPGDTWESKRDVPGAGGVPMSVAMTYTFKGWEDRNKQKCALFEMTGTVTNRPGPNPMGMTITIDTGIASGKSWFNPELGLFVETEANMDIAMKMSSPALQGQTMSSVVKSKVTSKLMDVGALAEGGAPKAADGKAPEAGTAAPGKPLMVK